MRSEGKKQPPETRGEESPRIKEGEGRKRTKRVGKKRSRGKLRGDRKKTKEEKQRDCSENQSREGKNQGEAKDKRRGKRKPWPACMPVDVRVHTLSGGWVCL